MRQLCALCIPRVLQQTASCLQRSVQVLAAEGAKVSGFEMGCERASRIVEFELPHWPLAFGGMSNRLHHRL